MTPINKIRELREQAKLKQKKKIQEELLEKLDEECVGNDEIWNPKKDGIYDSVKNIRDWMDKHVRDFKKHL